MAVYGQALTTGRIQAHYWAGVAQTTAVSPSYPTAVLTDTPTGYWKLADASGTAAADASGSNNSGAISGGVSLNQPGATADGVNAMGFDGATGVITIANTPALNFAKAVTLEAWVYLPAMPAAFTNLIDKASYNEYRLGVDTTGSPKVSLQVTNGSQYNYVDNCPGVAAPPAMSLNHWHHLVYTFDGLAGVVRMYVDGVQACQSAQTNNANPLTAYNSVYVTTNPLVLGRDMSGTGYLNGRLDEVAVYATALTTARVRAHFQASQVQFPNQTLYSRNALSDQPQGYWRLGDGTGRSVADFSGNGNTGSIAGGVTLNAGSVTTDGNTAASFDGSTGTITVANVPALNFGKALSLEAWVYLPAMPAVFTNVIDKASYGEYRLGVDTTASPKASMQVTNGSLSNYVDSQHQPARTGPGHRWDWLPERAPGRSRRVRDRFEPWQSDVALPGKRAGRRGADHRPAVQQTGSKDGRRPDQGNRHELPAHAADCSGRTHGCDSHSRQHPGDGQLDRSRLERRSCYLRLYRDLVAGWFRRHRGWRRDERRRTRVDERHQLHLRGDGDQHRRNGPRFASLQRGDSCSPRCANDGQIVAVQHNVFSRHRLVQLGSRDPDQRSCDGRQRTGDRCVDGSKCQQLLPDHGLYGHLVTGRHVDERFRDLLNRDGHQPAQRHELRVYRLRDG